MIWLAFVASSRVVGHFRQAWADGTNLSGPAMILIRWGLILSVVFAAVLLLFWAIHRRSFAIRPRGALWAFAAGWHWFLAAIALVYWHNAGLNAVWAGLVGFFMIGAGAERFRTALQHSIRDADEILLRNARPPSLYLRSFVSDSLVHPDFGDPQRQLQIGFFKILRPTFWIHHRQMTFEEVLCSGIGSLGPVISIGRPGESLPQMGAFRKYVTDDRWRDEVHDLLSRTQLVAILLGRTPGILWELSELIRRSDGTRVLLILPPGPGKAELWAGFKSMSADHALAVALPSIPDNAVAVGFRPGWQAIVFVGRPSAAAFREIAEMCAERIARNG